MKNIYNILFVSALAFSIVSCDSFLDDQPRGKAIAETTDQYNGMFQTTEFMNMSMTDYTTWLSDDIELTPECVDQLSSMFWSSKPSSIMHAFRYDKDVYETTESCTAWESCYKKIYTFNAIANGVMDSKDGTEAEKKALRAEARISRAWMHFCLAQMFSKRYCEKNLDEPTIPIVTEANSMATDFKRATMRELYQFIVTEMEESCPDLPDKAEHNMRVYKTTGYALLGKLYWLMGEYKKAIEPLRIAYERTKNDQQDIFMRNFNDAEAKYDYRELLPSELDGEQSYSTGSRVYLLPSTFANQEMLWVKQNAGLMGVYYWGYYNMVAYYLKPETYQLFDEYDLRRNLIPTKDADGNPTVMPVGGIRDQTQNYGVELPEIYLALAECEAREGSQDNARQLLKEFRGYRVRPGHEEVPADVQTKDQLIRFCLDEEHREFLGRPQRVWDLRRLWDDPIFQSEKPIKHSDGTNTYELTEDALYLQLPESVLKWNESWR